MGATQSTQQEYILETRLGRLKGIEQRDLSGKSILHCYLKVPYALPPTAERRWQRPRPLPSGHSFNDASGNPGDYTRFGAICPQPVYATDQAFVANPNAEPDIENTASEDCLYLNIWVPAGKPPAGGWPVEFFIHGGWLQVGNANQSHSYDPFDLFASTSHPRIVVSPTYRLNVFGFLAGEDLASLSEDPSAGNYGFWDQRMALEWVSKNIEHFSGDASNITVGGLSAGANSTFFQLYHDMHRPAEDRLIRRIFLWSNAVAIQPSSTTSSPLTAQFDELCTVHNISTSLSPREKLDKLRAVSAEDLVAGLKKMKQHTFRASTDNDFIPATFLHSLHSGYLATLLSKHNIHVLFGEVRDEAELYKLINPPSSYSDLIVQLENYYPKPVVDALLPIYDVPPQDSTDAQAFTNVFSKMVADCQVHASGRGLAHVLLNPPKSPDVTPLKPSAVHRYHIAFRAKCMDHWVKPSVGVCHSADTPIWWCSGWRFPYSEEDKKKVLAFLEPFGQYLYGEPPHWGDKSGENSLRKLDAEGNTQEDVRDEYWERGLQVWNVVWDAQKDLVAKL